MYEISDKTKSLMLLISLKVADGAPGAPKGSSILTNIVLSPIKGADKKTLENTIRLMKPRIVALTGEENISITPEWIDEWLVPEFAKKPEGGYELVKDHKMKKQVMVIIEDDLYENKAVLKVKSIMKAQPGDKSIPNDVVVEEESQQQMKPPSESEFPDDKIKRAVDTGDSESPPSEDDIPEKSSIPDDF